MIAFPNAKINLGLNIVAKRPDGYHNIETVFYPLASMMDALELTPAKAGEGRFHQSGLLLDSDADSNLVMKAYRLLNSRYDLPELDVYLHKNIPSGAGLGGGSADAAFMLKMLNEMAGLNLPERELEEIAAALGADCPFFVRNRPVFATGIGNVLEEIALSLNAYEIAVVNPGVHVSTREAYSKVRPRQPELSLKEIVRLPPEEWNGKMVNDFEESVFAIYPEIKALKEEMYRKGAVYASMSGSGSSVFGLFPK